LLGSAMTRLEKSREQKIHADKKAQEEKSSQESEKPAAQTDRQALQVPEQYAGVDLASMFATDLDVEEPSECVDLFDKKNPPSEKPQEQGVFKRPRVLLLDLEMEPKGQFNMGDKFLAEQGLRRTLMNTFRMKRNDYIVPCKKVKLEDIKGKKLQDVDFVFHLTLKKWTEDRGKKNAKLEYVNTEFDLKIWDLRSGKWEEYGDADIGVPNWLDKGVFMAEDAGNAAVEKTLDSTGLKDEIKSVANMVKGAKGGVVSDKFDDEKKNWYVYKVKQTLSMAGKKLGVEVARCKDFRLRSPVLSRQDDEIGIGVGEAEGVRLSDTFLFVRSSPDDWEGFGRVDDVGPGGAEGMKNHSNVEVIADYDSPDDEIKVLEYPVVGIMAGLSLGLLPFRHNEIELYNGDVMAENPIGMFGLALDFRWRIPWLPICELYQTNRISFPIDAPIFIMSIDIGFEKRWFWGRFAPVLGLRYSLGIVGMPMGKPGNHDEQVRAIGIGHGLEGYTGFNIFVHPAVTLSLQTGWRQFFSDLDSFTFDDFDYHFTGSNGRPWSIDLSGPFLLLGATYEY